MFNTQNQSGLRYQHAAPATGPTTSQSFWGYGDHPLLASGELSTAGLMAAAAAAAAAATTAAAAAAALEQRPAGRGEGEGG